MELVTPSSPILLVPSWGATLPLMTISVLAKDYYNISLWLHPSNQSCDEAYQSRTLRLVKWKWLWLESSHWLHWEYSYPGSYCITTTPFSCRNCQAQIWGEFRIAQDTSMNALACYQKRVSLSLTSVHRHRYDPVKKSVRLRLELGGRNSFRTRFYAQILDADVANCRQGNLSSAHVIAGEEFIVGNDLAFHDIPINSSTICVRVIPWCSDCAFVCSATLHLVELETKARQSVSELRQQRQCFSILKFLTVWLGMTTMSCFVIFGLTKRMQRNQLPPDRTVRLTPGQFSVIDFD